MISLNCLYVTFEFLHPTNNLLRSCRYLVELLSSLLSIYTQTGTASNEHTDRLNYRKMDARITPMHARVHQPCAACRMLRRRCDINCSLAPYFPIEEIDKFAGVHRVFGASNVIKMIQVSRACSCTFMVSNYDYLHLV